MRCPRCNAWLREYEPNLTFLRYFECEDCWVRWHIEGSVLVLGRKRREQGS